MIAPMPHDHSHDHSHDDHPHRVLPSEPALRVKALETILTQKGLIDPAALDEIIDTYENRIGPRNGAHVVARAWSDEAFKESLKQDATAAIKQAFGWHGRQGEQIVAVEVKQRRLSRQHYERKSILRSTLGGEVLQYCVVKLRFRYLDIPFSVVEVVWRRLLSRSILEVRDELPPLRPDRATRRRSSARSGHPVAA